MVIAILFCKNKIKKNFIWNKLFVNFESPHLIKYSYRVIKPAKKWKIRQHYIPPTHHLVCYDIWQDLIENIIDIDYKYLNLIQMLSTLKLKKETPEPRQIYEIYVVCLWTKRWQPVDNLFRKSLLIFYTFTTLITMLKCCMPKTCFVSDIYILEL